MLSHQRRAIIIDTLRRNGVYTIKEFTKLFSNYSESTIRRDLHFLEQLGQIITFHGGDIVLKNKSYEDSFYEKMLQDNEEKIKIAKYAANYIQNGQTIYLDSSTTVFHMLPFIKKDITIVTNSVKFDTFEPYDFEVYQIGGKVTKESSYGCYDSMAKDILRRFNFDLAFIGCAGIDENKGITFPKIEEAIFERAVQFQSNQAYVLSTPSKFFHSYVGKAFSINECDIITTSCPKSLKKYKNIHETIKS